MSYGLTEGVQFNPGLYTGFGMFFYFAVNYFRCRSEGFHLFGKLEFTEITPLFSVGQDFLRAV